jgi:chitodextrinase
MVGSRTRLDAATLLAAILLAAAVASSAPASVDAVPARPGDREALQLPELGRPVLYLGMTASKASGRRVNLRTPSRVAQGDVLLAAVTVRARSARAIVAPRGWRLLRRASRRDGQLAQALYLRVAGEDEPRLHSWKLRVSRGGAAALLAYRGLDTARPILGHAGRTGRRTAAVTVPSLTTDVGGALLVGFFGATGSGRTTPPSGMRERFDIAKSRGWRLTASAADAAQTTAGPTGARTARFPSPREIVLGQLVALRPAAAGAPATSLSAPGGLEVTGTTQTSVNLAWSATGDLVGLAAYGVYVDGVKVGETALTTYVVSGLACGTSYTLAVDAVDAAGNRSAQTTVTGATGPCTPGDTTPPSTPSGLDIEDRTQSSVTLNWNGIYDQDVVGYGVYRDGTKIDDTSYSYYTLIGLACGTSYTFAVDAADEAGNRSAQTTVTGATGPCTPGDTTPPAAPTGLTTTGATPTSVSLDWNAASDDVGVTSYGVYRNGTKMADAVLTAHTVSGLFCGTSYTFAVDAADAAGNRSAQASVSGSTAPCPLPDTTPPSTPSGLAVTASTQTSVSLDWNAASDDVAVTSYGVYRNGTKVADAVLTAHTVSGLSCGTSYTFAVDAADAAGNRSAQASITASTSACSPPPSGCPSLLTQPPPGYCTGEVISVSPATFGTGVFGLGGIAVAPGDVIVFEDGVYTDTSPGDGTIVQINGGGTSSQYVTFVSRNRWGAKIDGVSNTSKYGFSFGALTGNVRIEGFDIYGLGSPDVGVLVAPSASGVFAQAGGDNSQVVGNNIHSISNFCNDTIRAQTGVFIQRPGVVVENNVFHGIGRLDQGEDGCTYPSTFTKYRNSDTAVYLQSPNHSNVTIRNNLFSKLENGYGVYVYQGGPSGLKVLNNTFAGGNPYCKNAHIFTDADMNDFQVKNNVFQGPAGGYAWAWDLEPLTNVVFGQNVASGGLLVSGANCSSGISPLPAGVTESGNQLNTDPRLVDPGAPLTGGFKLQSSSPAVDAGANLSELGVTFDFEGATRPQGAGFDIGAYEVAGGPPPSDAQAPSPPTSVAKTGSTTTSISLSWSAATDNVGVTGYALYRDGASAGSTASTSTTFGGLTCGSSYLLGVEAYDAAGNHSARATLTASTDACPPPPPPPPPGCPTLMTPTPVPGYCTGTVITVTPSTFGSGVFGSGGIAVSPGDVVVFESGTYTDTNGDGAVMTITGSGTSTQWITFVSRTKWGAHMWGNDNDAAEGIALAGADYVRVEGFEVSDVGNVGSPRGSASGIDLYNGGKHSQIVGNHVHHVGRVCADPGNTNGQVGIYIQTGKSGGNIVVENNLVHDIGRFFVGENGCGNTTVSLDHGMYLNGSAGGGGGASNLTIRNNIFHDTHHGWGVQMYPGSLDNVHVVNNTFAFCNESKSYTCIVLDATITNSSIKNNVFYNPSGGRTIEAAGFTGAITIGTNLTSGSAMHDQGSTPSGMTLLGNLLGTNAQLVSPPSDFHLRSTSPAIDAGEALSYVVVDHEGRARPQGSGFDIGAYEFAG